MSSVCYLCLGKTKIPKPNDPKKSLHMFPRRGNTRQKWLSVCGLSEARDDVSRIKLCSLHFTKDDYVEPNAKIFGGRMVLKHGAVPSLMVPYPVSISHPCQADTVEIPNVTSEILTNEEPPLIFYEIVQPQTASTSTVESELTGQSLQEAITLMDDTPLIGNVEIHQNFYNEDTTQDIPPQKQQFPEPSFITEIDSSDVITKKAQQILTLVQGSEEKDKRIKKLQNQNAYLLRRIDSFKDLILQLKEKGLMSEEAMDLLLVHFPKSIKKIHACRKVL